MPEYRKIGRPVMYCERCNVYFIAPKGPFHNKCQKCGNDLPVRRCTRCGHKWEPRNESSVAKVCPKCKSPYWNRERVRGEAAVARDRSKGLSGTRNPMIPRGPHMLSDEEIAAIDEADAKWRVERPDLVAKEARSKKRAEAVRHAEERLREEREDAEEGWGDD